MRRGFIIVIFALLVILIMLVGTVLWLATTESGTRWLVSMAEYWAPGELQVEKVEGQLSKRLHLTGIHYQLGELATNVDDFLLVWDSSQLLTSTPKVHIQTLHVDGVKVQLPPAAPTQTSTEPFVMPDIALPVQVFVDDVQVSRVSIEPAGATPIEIDRLTLKAHWTDKLYLDQLSAATPLFNAQAEAKGQAQLVTPHQVQLDLNWSAVLPQVGQVAGNGKLQGGLDKLLLTHTISEPFNLNLHATAENLLSKPQWDAQLDWQQVYYPLDGQARMVELKAGQVRSQGSLDGYDLYLQTDIDGANVPAGHWQLDAQGDLQHLILNKLHATTLQGVVSAQGNVVWQPALNADVTFDANQLVLQELWADWPTDMTLNTQIHVTAVDNLVTLQQLNVTLPPSQAQITAGGTVSLQQASNPRFDLNLAWQQLQWTLLGDAPLARSPSGTVKLIGDLQNYQLNLDTTVDGQQVPSGQWQLVITGDLQHADITRLHGQTLQGDINATGSASWHDGVKAQLSLDGNNLVITPLWAGWDKSLQLNTQLQVDFVDNLLTLQKLTATIPQTQTQFNATGTTSLANPLAPQFDFALDWRNVQWDLAAAQPLLTIPTGTATVRGTPNAYQLDAETAVNSATLPDSRWQLSVAGDTQQARIQRLHGQMLQGQIEATGQARWLPQLQADLKLNTHNLKLTELWPDWDEQLSLNTQALLEVDQTDVRVRDITITLPPSKATLRANATADISQPEAPQFDFTARWQALQFPLLDKQPLATAPQGELKVAGTPNAYQLRFESRVDGAQVPAGHWRAQGQGDTQQFRLEHLKGDLLAGAVQVTGQAHWVPQVQWDFKVNGNKLNLGEQWAGLDSQIGLNIDTQGSLQADGVHAQLNVNQLGGTLRGYPLDIKTNAVTEGTRYRLPKFTLHSGQNRVTAQASYDTQGVQANWKIDAPDLRALLPQLSGKLNGSGEVSGQLPLPTVSSQLKGDSLAFDTLQLKTLDVDMQLRADETVQIKLLADHLTQNGEMLLQAVNLDGNGRLTQHELAIRVQRNRRENALLQVSGGLDMAKLTWTGLLQQFQFHLRPPIGTWALAEPATLSASPQAAHIAQYCIVQEKSTAQLCTRADWSAENGAAFRTALEHLDLQNINPSVTGTLGVNIDATLDAQGVYRADAGISVSGGTISAEVNGQPRQVNHKGGNVTALVTPEFIRGQFALGLAQQDGFYGEFNLPNIAQGAAAQTKPLHAILQGQIEDLGVLASLISQVENTHGRLELDTQVGGTLQAPSIIGGLTISNAGTELLDFGLNLQDLNLSVESNPEKLGALSIKGGLKSGKGELNFDGDVALLERQLELNIQGQDFEAIKTPDVWAILSPDLQIRFDPQLLYVRGTLTIPRAAITPSLNLTSFASFSGGGGAVAPSNDVIIINDPDEPVDAVKKVPFAIDSRVRLILGKHIIVDAVGFKSNITGDLLLTNSPKQVDFIPIANGEIQVVDGVFRSFGQDLEIERGWVTFSDVPATKPTLNIKAIRRIYGDDNVDEAGVHITGTALQPKLEFYSNPPLEQSRVLSYIFTGSDIGQGSNRLSLGLYVLPRLYVSYGVDLLENKNGERTGAFNMRYDIGRTWGVELEVGAEDKGIDFSYRFEK